jgi:5,6-dimethylbenzimidazole synthase
MVEGVVMTEGAAFEMQERDAVYRAIATRRDVRRGFLDKLLPDDLIRRLLCAAHSAPSVGLMQPSRFILIRDQGIRRAVHAAFLQANERAIATYTGERREQYARLKLEGILEAPQNLCVVSDLESERGHQVGRHTMPETAIYSTVCAIQNLWLAARAEGVGVGWVSILDPPGAHRGTRHATSRHSKDLSRYDRNPCRERLRRNCRATFLYGGRWRAACHGL